MGKEKTKISSQKGKRTAQTPHGSKNSKSSKSSNGANTPKKGGGKVLKILLIVAVSLLVVVAGLYIYITKFVVVPPDIIPDQPTQTPAVSATPTPTVKPDDHPDPSPTPDDEDPVETGEPSLRREGVYTVLVMGHNYGLTDVMMLASFDTVNGEINVMSIPRDTFSDTKTRSVRKINGAYNTGGMDLVFDEVERLIGFRPDNYVLVDYDGFIELIDAIGGVDFDVPVRMWHRDDDGSVDIDLQPGYQHLNGKQALGLCRFRSGYPGQDLGRISTAQEFMKAAGKKAISTISFSKISDYVDIYSTYVETDLSVGNIIWFMQQAWQNVDFNEGLNFYTLPVEGGSFEGGSYVFAIEDEALEMINSTINPYTYDITSDDVSMLTQSQARSKYGS